MPDQDDFYASVPVFDGFARLMDPDLYLPLPDGWVVGLSDVVGSTAAIAAGRYKVVNTAGAAAIAAVSNAVQQRDFPFVFGGDGASFAVGPADAPAAALALAATAAWSAAELGLELRVAMLSVAEIRASGADVRVARYAASPDVSYAMFTGGGLAFLERAMKAGTAALPAAPVGARPDLSGLSCRWQPIEAERDLVLSLICTSAPSAPPAAFRALVERLLDEVERSADGARPMVRAPGMRWPPAGLALEARASRRPSRAAWRQRLALAWQTVIGTVLMRFDIAAAGFDPRLYKRQLIANADFRKYDDGLRMTLDCTLALADSLERTLQDAAAAGTARYGLHRQRQALMTCIVPNVRAGNHVHFVDGATGGYAEASRALKASA